MEELEDKLLSHLSDINGKKDNIRELLGRSHEIYGAYRKRRRHRQIAMVAFASMGLAACLAGLLFLPSFTKIDGETLFLRYYERYPFEVAVRSGAIPEPLTRAVGCYVAGRVGEALACIDSLLYVNPKEQRAWLIKGLTELDMDNYTAARAALTHITGDGGVTGQAAMWYFALSLVREGLYKEASRQLQAIKSEGQNPYSGKATELYRRIRFRKAQ